MDTSKLEVYENLGWELKSEGTQYLAECPFCGKSKLYIDPHKTTFHCKVCGKSGNDASVFQLMHELVYRPALTDAKTRILAEYRGLPYSAFSVDEELGWDNITGQFVWLVSKGDGKFLGNSLRSFMPPRKGQKNAVKAFKGKKIQGLIGARHLQQNGPVYLVEGEWDRISFLNLLLELELPGIVVSVPGASTFPTDMASWFTNRDVIVLFDNDKAGRDGHNLLYKRLRKVVKQIRFIHWDKAKEESYDIDNLIKANFNRLTEAWSYIQGQLRPIPVGFEDDPTPQEKAQASQEDVDPISVAELHSVFKKWLQLKNCDMLDVMMGTMLAVQLQGDPLWMLLVAPPAGSKSETIMPASAWWRCMPMSTISSKALISGFQIAGGGDPSVLAKLEGKKSILMVKDLTPMLQASGEERDEVFSILRDAYDGSITKFFGNNVTRSYDNLHFSIIAGVTPVIDSFDNTAMGERFLKFRSEKYTRRWDDVDKARRAILNSGFEDDMRKELRDACVACLQRPFLESRIPNPSIDFVGLISQISTVVAYARAVAPVKEGTELQTMEPVIEVPTRIAKQLTKLAKGLALHYEIEDLMHEKITSLVKRVALHTPDSMTIRILMTLFRGPELGCTKEEFAEKNQNLSSETVRFILSRMQMIGYVTRIKDVHGAVLYALQEDFRTIVKNSTIFDLPPHDMFSKEENEPITTD